MGKPLSSAARRARHSPATAFLAITLAAAALPLMAPLLGALNPILLASVSLSPQAAAYVQQLVGTGPHAVAISHFGTCVSSFPAGTHCSRPSTQFTPNIGDILGVPANTTHSDTPTNTRLRMDFVQPEIDRAHHTALRTLAATAALLALTLFLRVAKPAQQQASRLAATAQLAALCAAAVAATAHYIVASRLLALLEDYVWTFYWELPGAVRLHSGPFRVLTTLLAAATASMATLRLGRVLVNFASGTRGPVRAPDTRIIPGFVAHMDSKKDNVSVSFKQRVKKWLAVGLGLVVEAGVLALMLLAALHYSQP